MHLINTETLEMETFLDPTRVYSSRYGKGTRDGYAILSHRWSDQEVSFEEYNILHASEEQRALYKSHLSRSNIEALKQRSGYRKVMECCAKARSHGFNWVWVDTCCIKKTNESELAEAINSMWRWYELSQVCYVYMADVPAPRNSNPNQTLKFFCASSWWSRCWTLQELLAPKALIFYSQSWMSIGKLESPSPDTLSRSDMEFASLVSAASGIPIDYLTRLKTSIQTASVAQRMSWAAHRVATKVEDQAYSLLGLFGVHMPTVYGEGDRAFIRLQKTILEHIDDESLFVWKTERKHEECVATRGILAPDPQAFKHSGKVVRYHNVQREDCPVTNRGLYFDSGSTGSRSILECQARGIRAKGTPRQLGELITLNCSFVSGEGRRLEDCTMAVSAKSTKEVFSPQFFERFDSTVFGNEFIRSTRFDCAKSLPRKRQYLLLR